MTMLEIYNSVLLMLVQNINILIFQYLRYIDYEVFQINPYPINGA